MTKTKLNLAMSLGNRNTTAPEIMKKLEECWQKACGNVLNRLDENTTVIDPSSIEPGTAPFLQGLSVAGDNTIIGTLAAVAPTNKFFEVGANAIQWFSNKFFPTSEQVEFPANPFNPLSGDFEALRAGILEVIARKNPNDIEKIQTAIREHKTSEQINVAPTTIILLHYIKILQEIEKMPYESTGHMIQRLTLLRAINLYWHNILNSPLLLEEISQTFVSDTANLARITAAMSAGNIEEASQIKLHAREDLNFAIVKINENITEKSEKCKQDITHKINFTAEIESIKQSISSLSTLNPFYELPNGGIILLHNYSNHLKNENGAYQTNVDILKNRDSIINGDEKNLKIKKTEENFKKINNILTTDLPELIKGFEKGKNFNIGKVNKLFYEFSLAIDSIDDIDLIRDYSDSMKFKEELLYCVKVEKKLLKTQFYTTVINHLLGLIKEASTFGGTILIAAISQQLGFLIDSLQDYLNHQKIKLDSDIKALKQFNDHRTEATRTVEDLEWYKNVLEPKIVQLEAASAKIQESSEKIDLFKNKLHLSTKQNYQNEQAHNVSHLMEVIGSDINNIEKVRLAMKGVIHAGKENPEKLTPTGHDLLDFFYQDRSKPTDLPPRNVEENRNISALTPEQEIAALTEQNEMARNLLRAQAVEFQREKQQLITENSKLRIAQPITIDNLLAFKNQFLGELRTANLKTSETTQAEFEKKRTETSCEKVYHAMIDELNEGIRNKIDEVQVAQKNINKFWGRKENLIKYNGLVLDLKGTFFIATALKDSILESKDIDAETKNKLLIQFSTDYSETFSDIKKQLNQPFKGLFSRKEINSIINGNTQDIVSKKDVVISRLENAMKTLHSTGLIENINIEIEQENKQLQQKQERNRVAQQEKPARQNEVATEPLIPDRTLIAQVVNAASNLFTAVTNPLNNAPSSSNSAFTNRVTPSNANIAIDLSGPKIEGVIIEHYLHEMGPKKSVMIRYPQDSQAPQILDRNVYNKNQTYLLATADKSLGEYEKAQIVLLEHVLSYQDHTKNVFLEQLIDFCKKSEGTLPNDAASISKIADAMVDLKTIPNLPSSDFLRCLQLLHGVRTHDDHITITAKPEAATSVLNHFYQHDSPQHTVASSSTRTPTRHSLKIHRNQLEPEHVRAWLNNEHNDHEHQEAIKKTSRTKPAA